MAENVTSYNQSGGITAGTVNIGPQPRSLANPNTDELKKQILRELPRDKPIVIQAVMSDTESMSFAEEIHAFLKSNGFQLDGEVVYAMFVSPLKGLFMRDEGAKFKLIVGANQ